jgi:DNA-binding transcriptional LysR family regulator
MAPHARPEIADIEFLRGFFAALPGSSSMKAVATKLGMNDPSNLAHHLDRALEPWGHRGRDVHNGTKLTPAGEELAARVRDLWRLLNPLLPRSDGSRKFAGRLPVRLALPELFTGRPFAELLRRLHEQPWGDDLELVTRRCSPQELERSLKAGPDDLVLTISGAPPNSGQKLEWPSKAIAFRRVLLGLNDDPLSQVDQLGGSSRELGDEEVRGRSLYLPPDNQLPGFCFWRFERLCDVHSAGSFAEAHAHVLAGRRVLAVAHPEVLDELEDKLCTTIPIGQDAGVTHLTLHRPPRPEGDGAWSRLVDRVFEVIARHLEAMSERTARADLMNNRLRELHWIAYTSNAAVGDASAFGIWRWRFSQLENFHVTALGHLKGRHTPVDHSEVSFDVFGRVMHANVGSDGLRQHHALWRSVDHMTQPGDTEPRQEHFSVNLIFRDDELDRDRMLVGLWSGRRSGPGIWEPGCGIIILTNTRRPESELNSILYRFQNHRLQHWQIPVLADK